MAITIIEWEKHFENSQSKRWETIRWVPIPNKQGLGYKKIMQQKNGAEIFGCWIAIIECASRQKPRGIITMSIEDLSLETMINTATLYESIKYLSDKLNWLCVDSEQTKSVPSPRHTSPPDCSSILFNSILFNSNSIPDNVCDINTSSENSNSSDSKKESIKKKEKNVPEFAMKLAEYLKEKIVESGTDMVFKDSHLTGWADDFRLMVTSDKRTVDDIQKKIDDIFVDSFWSKQIRSAGKMREQWKAGKLDGLKPRQTAIALQQENSAQGVDLYASEKKYDSGRCRRYIDAMLRKLYPVEKYGEKWESYIIPESDIELMPIWDTIVADGGYINGVKTKEAALKIVSMLKVYS